MDNSKHTVLANGFQKLPVLEIQTDQDYLESCLVIDFDENNRASIEMIVNSDLKQVKDLTPTLSNTDTDQSRADYLTNLIYAIESKLVHLTTAESSLIKLSKQIQTITKQENNLLTNKTKLITKNNIGIHLIDKLLSTCSEQERQYNHKQAEFNTNLDTEQQRTITLTNSCEKSIQEVICSVEKEESELCLREITNSELSQKLIDFKQHLSLRSQQKISLKQTIKIKNEIKINKLLHLSSCKLSNENTLASYSKNIQTQKHKIQVLESQVYTYTNKLHEFEKTLIDTKSLFQSVEERGKQISNNAYIIEQKNQKIFTKAEIRQKELEKLLNNKLILDKSCRLLFQECDHADLYCRTLQAKRSGLSKLLEGLADVEGQISDGIGKVDDVTKVKERKQRKAMVTKALATIKAMAPDKPPISLTSAPAVSTTTAPTPTPLPIQPPAPPTTTKDGATVASPEPSPAPLTRPNKPPTQTNPTSSSGRPPCFCQYCHAVTKMQGDTRRNSEGYRNGGVKTSSSSSSSSSSAARHRQRATSTVGDEPEYSENCVGTNTHNSLNSSAGDIREESLAALGIEAGTGGGDDEAEVA